MVNVWMPLADMKVRVFYKVLDATFRLRITHLISIASSFPKLLDWNHADFHITVSTKITIYHLKQMLKKKHGRIEKLVLCKNEFRESNEMMEENKTLDDYGFKGSSSKDDAPLFTICYDFKPIDQDPILLA